MNNSHDDSDPVTAMLMIAVAGISALIGASSSLVTSWFVVSVALVMHLQWGFEIWQATVAATIMSWVLYALIQRWAGPFVEQVDRASDDR
jgi:hypothetical protein